MLNIASACALASKGSLPQEPKGVHDTSACQRTRSSTNNRPRKLSLCRARSQHQESSTESSVDLQQEQLAEAELEAKQSLYTQLLDRKRSSQSSETSSSGQDQANSTTVPSAPAPPGSTELIFRLERRGEGWGEEIFPHLVVEQRPWTDTKKRDRNRSSRPKPWTVRTDLLCCQSEGGTLSQQANFLVSNCASCHRRPCCPRHGCSSAPLLLLADIAVVSVWQLWLKTHLSLSVNRRGVLSCSCVMSVALMKARLMASSRRQLPGVSQQEDGSSLTGAGGLGSSATCLYVQITWCTTAALNQVRFSLERLYCFPLVSSFAARFAVDAFVFVHMHFATSFAVQSAVQCRSVL